MSGDHAETSDDYNTFRLVLQLKYVRMTDFLLKKQTAGESDLIAVEPYVALAPCQQSQTGKQSCSSVHADAHATFITL